MKKIMQTAPCRFCGQMVQFEGDSDLTDPQKQETATMTCTCPEAVEYQKEKQRKEKALKNVSVLFGEDAAPEKRIGEGIVSILRAAVEEIYSGGHTPSFSRGRTSAPQTTHSSLQWLCYTLPHSHRG